MHNVTARYLSDGKLEIRLQVTDESLASVMFDRITTIPELGPYQMKVKVELAR